MQMKKEKLFFVPVARSNPSLRLYCFPYAGGSSNIYLDWIDALPETIELVLVQPPGRGTRMSEAPHSCMHNLIEELLGKSSWFTEIPYAFFGHSLGSRVAFELASQLTVRGLRPPIHLIASGSRAPHIEAPSNLNHDLSDKELTERIFKLKGTPTEILQHPELLQLLLPMLRADFKISDTYRAQKKQLTCPISVFYGSEDVDDLSRLYAWGELSKSNVELQRFEGDHFFLNQRKMEVIESVKTLLLKEFTKGSVGELSLPDIREKSVC